MRLSPQYLDAYEAACKADHKKVKKIHKQYLTEKLLLMLLKYKP